MAFDYKKEFKELYLPPMEPQIVTVPKMQFVAVRGKGNPNDEDGEYKAALGVEFGEYSLRQYRYAKDYSRLALAEMEEI